MNTKSRKLSAWYYGLGALVFVAGCLLTAVILFQGAKELPGLIKKAYDLDRLAQVVVPGSTELTLTRTGVYGVYYEYRSSVDGVQYMGGQTPPTLTCSIISNASGKEIPVVPDFVDTNRYSGGGGSYKERREGVLVMSTTIAKPGNYTFSCQYPGGKEQPEIVVSVGQNIAWEVIQALLGTAKHAFSGLAIMCAASIVAIFISAVIAVKRHQAGKYQL